MILVVKKWARHNQINDASKGTLSSYTLVLMVLHYLQSQCNHKHTHIWTRSLLLLSFDCWDSHLLFFCSPERASHTFPTAGLPSKSRQCWWYCFTAVELSLEGSVLRLWSLLSLNLQECFNPHTDIDLVPEGPKRIPPYVSRNQSPLGELLLGFLEYYATQFRYLPRIVQSQVFENPPTLP